mmetsp:Transcript_7869/g.18205  ORF Transcript_7869/g.18205 Transcript_7869/m.18205 type:complete len:121 (-) Transcript_7869:1219-1581(-)
MHRESFGFGKIYAVEGYCEGAVCTCFESTPTDISDYINAITKTNALGVLGGSAAILQTTAVPYFVAPADLLKAIDKSSEVFIKIAANHSQKSRSHDAASSSTTTVRASSSPLVVWDQFLC